jgi:hypothetical protein
MNQDYTAGICSMHGTDKLIENFSRGNEKKEATWKI